uniref:Uncharacterized protein n=1 Tax=Eptatretus burgeri TaxID=7764 RepID=A0A8C4R3D8_EPTBU
MVIVCLSHSTPVKLADCLLVDPFWLRVPSAAAQTAPTTKASSSSNQRVGRTAWTRAVAERVVHRTQHELKGATLTVRMTGNSQGLEPSDKSTEENHGGDGMCGIVVEGVTATSINEEVLMVYFENQRRSGGGPVSSVLLGCHATALVIFEQVEDASRVLKQPHHFSGMALTVRASPVFDHRVLYLQGVPEPSNLLNEPSTTATLLKDHVMALLGMSDKHVVVFTVSCRDGRRNLLVVFTKSLSYQGAVYCLVTFPTSLAIIQIHNLMEPILHASVPAFRLY